jgi:hypothetical protein
MYFESGALKSLEKITQAQRIFFIFLGMHYFLASLLSWHTFPVRACKEICLLRFLHIFQKYQPQRESHFSQPFVNTRLRSALSSLYTKEDRIRIAKIPQ